MICQTLGSSPELDWIWVESGAGLDSRDTRVESGAGLDMGFDGRGEGRDLSDTRVESGAGDWIWVPVVEEK